MNCVKGETYNVARVTSRDLAQGIDHRAQARQTLVDVSCFLQPLSFSVGQFLALGSGEVDQVEP